MQSGNTPQTPDYFAGLKAPTADDLSYQLEQLVQQGVLTPEQAQAQLVKSSDMNNISLDPKLKEAQMSALSGLQDISHGGLTDMDEANLNRIRTEEDTASKGKRDAIVQNAESRGLGGSGLSLMDQMLNEQQSATRNSQRDMDVAGGAQQRALQALIEGGQLGGQIGQQDFNQKSTVAGANDAIAKFNTQNKQATNMANVNAANVAQEANLANKQNIANQNTAIRTQQAAQKGQVAQQQFSNELQKRGGSAGIAQNNAANAGKDSQGAANANNQMVGSLIGAGASIYGAKKKEGGMIEGPPSNHDSQPIVAQPGEVVIRKEDVPDLLAKAHTDKNGKFDAAAFLDTITGHKYGYKKGGKRAA